MAKKPSVEVEYLKNGSPVCKCHGWSVRHIARRPSHENPYYEFIHCEHPEKYVVYEDINIPAHCEKCGWNLSQYDRRDNG